ncbi:MAG: SDR family oxidoreductase [Candidatus Marinimicrobia bacterium]|nr:SDR family oxidoreductase [Candidatus Neomarinimicrobiota bacterium]MCF7830293.1 SDR family oxidoreductase [Candidatus Neomarinimicrobiota bacterium]MCF7882434.1 SDR family oxidoreductase [Candidatus Neomarinimicrobiota bacterium]
MDLSGKNTIVTGASQGIGREIATTYATAGAMVTVCARSENKLQQLQEECADLPGKIEYLAGDITEDSVRKQLLAKALDAGDFLDVLVNNAGLLGTRDSIVDYPDDVWEDVIDVNLNAMFHLTKLVLDPLLNQGSGRIINITSGVGVNGYANWGAYSVSKFGVEGLTQVLADEIKGTGVEVNAVNPGPISTEMRADAYPDEDPATIPSPKDIMDIFLYLASDKSKGNNGIRYEAQEYSLEKGLPDFKKL